MDPKLNNSMKANGSARENGVAVANGAALGQGGPASKSLASGPSERPPWELDLSKLILKNRIGAGAYGSVYRGTYNGQLVAVKVLEFGDSDTMARARFVELHSSFKQEVSMWSTLSHPNITKFIGASISDVQSRMLPSISPAPKAALGLGSQKGSFRLGAHTCCVVAEYVPGGTLKEFLIKHRRSKLPLRTVIQLALDLAQALKFMHEKKVVHRDIKSENLLLTKGHRLKVADFGVARVEAANPKDMTGSTGTLGYMAPEVLDGKPYNHKADAYSFGICLWEIYCCDMPFPNLAVRDMIAIVRNGLRPTVPGVCPKDLANLMTRCWDVSPAKRPEMSEAVSILEKVDTFKGQGMPSLEEVPVNRCLCLF